MFISPITILNKPTNYRNNSVQNTKKVNANPAFKQAEYMKVFNKYFNNPHMASNEQIFRELMTKAMNIKGAHIESIAASFFRPEDFNRIIEGSRKKMPVYETVNDKCYRKLASLIKSDNSLVATVFNMGLQGGLLDFLTFNIHNDIRLCFHDINNNKNVICLGRENDGTDKIDISRNGVAEIIRNNPYL